MALNVDDLFEFDNYLLQLQDGFYENVAPERPRRYIRDLENPLEFFTSVQFKLRYRFEKETVVMMMQTLHIAQRLQRNDNRGLPIPPLIQFLTALRFYASGSFQTILGDLRGIHQSTVSRTLQRVTEVIAEQMGAFVYFPDERGMAANRLKFFMDRGFPGVAGLIDCTHVGIQNPGGPYGELYRNRKRVFSLNVQIVCGPKREILDIVARWPGSTHDARIFDNSRVRVRFEQQEFSGCLIGDSGYPLTTYLLTPLLNPHDRAEERYNAAHKRVRNIVECCNGELKRRMLCLKKGLAYKPQKVNAFICACATLHNIALMVNDPVPEDDLPEPHVPVRQVIQHNQGPAAAFRRGFINQHFR